MIFNLWKFYFYLFRYRLLYLLGLLILGTLFEGLGIAVIISILDYSKGELFIKTISNYGFDLNIYTFVILVFILRGITIWYANFETSRLLLMLKETTLQKILSSSINAKFTTIEQIGDTPLTNLVIKEIPNIIVGFKVFMHMLRSLLLSVAYISIPIFFAPIFSIAIISFTLLSLGIAFPIQKYLRKLSVSLVESNERLLLRLKTIFNSLSNIKASNRNEKVILNVNDKIKDILKLEKKQTVVIEPALNSLLETIIFLVLIGIIIFNENTNILENSILILCIGMLFKALNSINGIYSSFRKIYSYSGSFLIFESIHNTLKSNKEVFLNEISTNDTLFKLSLRNISLAYNDKKIIDNFSINCQLGDTIAITGKSGSGKTSLLNSLATLTDIKSGSYFANENINIADNKLFLRNNASYLTQQYFFEETFIKECFQERFNVNNDIKESLVYLDLIKHKNDYEDFGEIRISQLSGGERQRLAIVKEFLKDKTFYLLDEITSGLDDEHENLVAEFIKLHSKNKIVFAVTHSVTFAKKLNRIIDLNSK